MTNNEMAIPEIIPGFDVLKWKQEIQDQIYQDIKDMTTDEWLTYVRKGSEEFREEQKRHRAESCSATHNSKSEPQMR